MNKNAGLRGGSGNAHRDDKMSGSERFPTPGWMRQIKKTANAKRKQHGKKLAAGERDR